jgi:hypothetical protein
LANPRTITQESPLPPSNHPHRHPYKKAKVASSNPSHQPDRTNPRPQFNNHRPTAGSALRETPSLNQKPIKPKGQTCPSPQQQYILSIDIRHKLDWPPTRGSKQYLVIFLPKRERWVKNARESYISRDRRSISKSLQIGIGGRNKRSRRSREWLSVGVWMIELTSQPNPLVRARHGAMNGGRENPNQSSYPFQTRAC